MTALMGLQTRLKLAKLQLITDLRVATKDFVPFVHAAFSGGVDIIEIRDAAAPQADLVTALEQARNVSYAFNGLVFLGNAPQAAAQAAADGLHLGAASTTDPATAKTMLHPWAVVGRSVHSGDELSAAVKDPAVDYLLVGPVFGAPVDGLAMPGLELVRAAVQASGVGGEKVWFAVGGIDAHTISQVLDAGALRVAVSTAISKAPDPTAAARELKDVLQAAWDAKPELQGYIAAAFGPQSNASFVQPPEAAGHRQPDSPL